MITIEDRLERAAADIRDKMAQVPPRTAGSAVQRVGTMRVARIATAIVVVAAAVVAAALALPRGEQTASGSPMPPLFLDVDRLDNDLGLRWVDDNTVRRATPDASATRLRSYGPPSAGLADPRVWVVTYPEGSDFFRGEGFVGPGWESTPVPSGSAYATTVGRSAAVMWNPGGDPSGPAVRIQGYGVDPDVVLDLVAGIEGVGGEWIPQTIPDGFVELYDGYDRLAPGERGVTFIWTGDPAEMIDGEVTLSLYAGIDETIAERNLFGFLPYGPGTDAAASAVEIRGHMGAMLVFTDGVLFQWMETPTVFARLLVQGPVDPEQILAALVELDPVEWADLVATWRPDPAPAGTTDTTVAPTTTSAG